ncbi:hypothetical protein BDBG_04342 [Blastomyces gilchristii SLH14081]|uniref:Aminoglycoside phosphotransferase domain-containing protein n=1 Tax=Blastomyces gilchristii (strain SLH14081) TaxID=559298 RepID=A0A179UK74_BLAGS|nr:uncharacterized protein BDBG_04342 [Blastomyces gilchristii SLH14081]OAT08384.1 hypothetical protein BDBG_04342 [Blastomyces gilchristii SLH14081]
MAAVLNHQRKILTINRPDAPQMNQTLMQAFHDALENNPSADLLSVVGAAYLRAHRVAQYKELSETGCLNFLTVNNLHDEINAHPEINLRDYFPSDYDRRYRWLMPTAKAEEKTLEPPQKKEPSDWLCEKLSRIDTASILYPLSNQATALIQKYSVDNSYSSPETALAAAMKMLILHSERLFDLSIRGVVVKCGDELAIKVFPNSRDLTEYHNLQYLAAHAAELPIPRVHGLVALGTFRAMFMSYIPGITLDKAWPSLSHEAKLSLRRQLDWIFVQLRSLQQRDGLQLGGVGGEGVKDYRIMEVSSKKGIITAWQFDELQFSAKHRASPSYAKLLRSFLKKENKSLRGSVFTHGDLKKTNILVEKDPRNADAYIVTGIIDWEEGGFYPEYYECTTLSNGQSIETDDDWYLYVPDSISPLRFPNLEDEILATIIRHLVADRCLLCDDFDGLDIACINLTQGTELDKGIRNVCVRSRSNFNEIFPSSTKEMNDGLFSCLCRIDEQAPVLDARVLVNGYP